MNRTDIETAARSLERSGVRFYRPNSRDGVNLTAYEPIPWQAAVVRIVSAFGWVVGPEIEDVERPELRLVGETEKDDG